MYQVFVVEDELLIRQSIRGGAGKGNAKHAAMHMGAFFRMLNARGYESHLACSGETDTLPADQDETAKMQVRALARWLNAPEAPPEFTGFQACGYRSS